MFKNPKENENFQSAYFHSLMNSRSKLDDANGSPLLLFSEQDPIILDGLSSGAKKTSQTFPRYQLVVIELREARPSERLLRF